MLAIIGIMYGALVAMVQPNMKKLVAYSSVSHLGFVVLGIFSFTQIGPRWRGLPDAQSRHLHRRAVPSGGPALRAPPLARNRRLRRRGDRRPWLSTAFLITTLASIGLPVLNNFVGEFLVLQGAAMANYTWTVWAAIGVIFSACYMLWLYQRVFYGETGEEVRHHILDLKLREWAAIVPLIRDDGLDGRLLAIVPAAGEQDHRPRARSDPDQRPLRVEIKNGHTCGRWRRAVAVSLVSSTDLIRFLPEIILTVMGTAIMVLDPLINKRASKVFGNLAILR